MTEGLNFGIIWKKSPFYDKKWKTVFARVIFGLFFGFLHILVVIYAKHNFLLAFFARFFAFLRLKFVINAKMFAIHVRNKYAI